MTKSVEEAAKDLQWVIKGFQSEVVIYLAIVKALTEFADEQRANEYATGSLDQQKLCAFHRRKAHNDAMEAAAGICDKRKEERYSADCAIEAGYMADEIRALKEPV